MQLTYDYCNLYSECLLCPRKCGVDRSAGELGVCGMPTDVYAARAALHMWEEPCISGTRGSGTVFFTGCSLRCVYCQNFRISREHAGVPVSARQLASVFLRLQNEQNANNINLVTAAHYLPHVIRALNIARDRGLSIPVVYNSSGYESVSALRLLRGLINVYLPDMKYVSSELSAEYSGARDYYNVCRAALDEMFDQVGEPVFAGDGDVCEPGIMKRGMIVRHLILPTHTDDSREVLAYLHTHFGNKIYISIMNQYTPIAENPLPDELSRPITAPEYEKVLFFARKLGIKNGFIQEGGTVAESFIPLFNGEGII